MYVVKQCCAMIIVITKKTELKYLETPTKNRMAWHVEQRGEICHPDISLRHWTKQFSKINYLLIKVIVLSPF